MINNLKKIFWNLAIISTYGCRDSTRFPLAWLDARVSCHAALPTHFYTCWQSCACNFEDPSTPPISTSFDCSRLLHLRFPHLACWGWRLAFWLMTTPQIYPSEAVFSVFVHSALETRDGGKERPAGWRRVLERREMVFIISVYQLCRSRTSWPSKQIQLNANSALCLFRQVSGAIIFLDRTFLK